MYNISVCMSVRPLPERMRARVCRARIGGVLSVLMAIITKIIGICGCLMHLSSKTLRDLTPTRHSVFGCNKAPN